MIISFAGNCASESVKLETINTQGGQTTTKVDVQIAVNRGAASKRYDFLQGKEYDCDFYRCTLFGKLAEAFVKYYAKGRPVSIAGQLLTNEFITKKEQAVIINPSNPMYNTIAPYIQAPNCRMQDGSVIIAGNYVVKQAVINVSTFNWLTANPNKDNNANTSALPSFNGVVPGAQAAPVNAVAPQAVAPAMPAPPTPVANGLNMSMPQMPAVNTNIPAAPVGAPFVPNGVAPGAGYGY